MIDIGLELCQLMLSEFGVIVIFEELWWLLISWQDKIACRIEITKGMPFEPAWVLRVLLGACNIHGAVEVGNELGRRLLQL